MLGILRVHRPNIVPYMGIFWAGYYCLPGFYFSDDEFTNSVLNVLDLYIFCTLPFTHNIGRFGQGITCPKRPIL